MSLSTIFRANRQRVTDTSGVLVMIEITHNAFTAPLRLVNDTQNWVSKGVTYVGYPFEFQAPSDEEGSTPQTKLVIDNLGGAMLDELEKVNTSEWIMVKVMIADRSTPDVHEMSSLEPATIVTVDSTTVTCAVGIDHLMRRSALLLRHDPATSPGIF